MDYEGLLKRGHSKEIRNRILDFIGNSQQKFDEFIPFFLHDEKRICQRAAWVLGSVAENHPELIEKWISEILFTMKNAKHDAILRNALRTFQFMDSIPEEFEGEIYEMCSNYLIDPKFPVAIKVFSMTTCRKIAMKYPELKPELIQIINDGIEYGTAGYKARAKKELKILRN